VLVGSGASFTEGAGTTSTVAGSEPVVVDDGSLSYSGSGASLIRVRGTSTLAGNVAKGQSLVLESTGGENLSLTAAVGFENAGSIAMTNSPFDTDANNSTLVVSTGTLTNSGTITTEADRGGTRTIQGSVTNTGTLAIDRTTAYNASAAKLVNKGAITFAAGAPLDVGGGSGVADETGGTIVGNGSTGIVQDGGTFEQGAGKSSGEAPVILDDGALDYTGTGASVIRVRGASTLSGDAAKGLLAISKGQSLTLESTGGENMTLTAPGSFVSSGTITMTNSPFDSDANDSTLSLSGGTLENKGKLLIEHERGGTRTIDGLLKSEKTLFVSAGATLALNGAYTQGKKGTLEVGINSASSFGSLSASGAAALEGTLSLKQLKTFKPSEGSKFAILTASSRTGTFAKVKNPKITKSTLVYEPTYTATGVTLVVAP
jgi:hypothetical protein